MWFQKLYENILGQRWISVQNINQISKLIWVDISIGNPATGLQFFSGI